MTATQAREIARSSFNEEDFKKVLEDIYAQIREASEKGEYAISIKRKKEYNHAFHSELVSALMDKGFKLATGFDKIMIQW